ncbi:thioredoxin family protein [Methanobacterium sp. ACI-7]|uniref:thioredoxin family protein n=1 Tax=unclassified Methanobacterium TaxID=2627676 RepID=UPI0039C33265
MQKSLIIVGIIVLAAIVAYAVLGSQSQQNVEIQSSDINWYTDLNQALGEAQKSSKPLFIDFYTVWCSSCQQLDKNTLSDPQVKEKLSKDYIPVKIDIDKNPQLASQYKIYGIPTLVFLNPDGSEIKRYEGYIGPQELLNQL